MTKQQKSINENNPYKCEVIVGLIIGIDEEDFDEMIKSEHT
jgi:hypothetical protein